MTPPGIWRHAELFGADLRAAHGWTLGEGDTPLEDWPQLAASLGLGRLRLKREDRNPGGSHKDRGLLFQVARARLGGATDFVLSSSGNAAISAARAASACGGRLFAFVAPTTEPAKLARLLTTDAAVAVTAKARNFARNAGTAFGLSNLRATLDPEARVGYRSLGAELAVGADAIVTFTTSGASAWGIVEALQALGDPAAVWSVQSGGCVAVAQACGPAAADPDSPAGRHGADPPDAVALADALRIRGGGAIAVPGPAVLGAADRMEAVGLRTAPEGAAVVAALSDPRFMGRDVIAVITGDAGQWPARHGGAPPAPRAPATPETWLEVRRWLSAHGLTPTHPGAPS